MIYTLLRLHRALQHRGARVDVTCRVLLHLWLSIVSRHISIMWKTGPELRLVPAGRLRWVLLLRRFVLLLLGIHHFYRLVLLRIAAWMLRWLLSLRILHTVHVILTTIGSWMGGAINVLWVSRSLVCLIKAICWAQSRRLMHQTNLVLHLLDVNWVHVHVPCVVVSELRIVQMVHVAWRWPNVELLLVLILAVWASILPASSWA